MITVSICTMYNTPSYTLYCVCVYLLYRIRCCGSGFLVFGWKPVESRNETRNWNG